MNLWLNENFFDNRKIDRLEYDQGAEAVLSVLRLWFYAGNYAVENLLDDDKIGILKDFDDVDFERVGRWKGEKGSFKNVLKSYQLIEKKYGQYYIHDFLDNNPQISVLIKQKINGSKYARKRWENKKKMGDPMGDLIGDLIGTPPSTHMQTEQNRTEQNKKEKNKKEKVTVELPAWLDKKSWEEWVQFRKEKKQKLTPSTIKKQLSFLEKNQEHHVEILERSIRNGWTGLFPYVPENGRGNDQGLTREEALRQC
jgi:hypothetical protein